MHMKRRAALFLGVSLMTGLLSSGAVISSSSSIPITREMAEPQTENALSALSTSFEGPETLTSW